MEHSMTITPEQKQAVENADGGPVRLEDPETHEQYVVLKAEVYERLSHQKSDDLDISSTYAAVDEAFREDWDAPGMSDYDEYESRRP